MARLLQVFGFLSVLFRGATLTFQSLAVGGIVFLMFVVRRAEEDSAALRHACLRWIRRSALALPRCKSLTFSRTPSSLDNPPTCLFATSSARILFSPV